jgi:hypothetical protein
MQKQSILLFMLAGAPLWGQVVGASISGTVKDATGAGIAAPG